jgi:FkbM family methyltransferase
MTPENYKKWMAAEGDKTLRVNYDLDESSLVIDVGGYEGGWAAKITNRYNCTIHIFEPITKFAGEIARRFVDEPNITVHAHGLAHRTYRTSISLMGDSSSVIKAGEQSEEVQLVDAVEFFQKHEIKPIDLIKINIEGSEYELLEHLIDTGFINEIRHLQVQFHDFVPDADRRRNAIQKRLAKTHELMWEFPFVWEGWKRKE